MPIPQTGIFALGTRTHYYLELDLRRGVEPRALLDVVAGLREPRTTTGGANLVLAFSGPTWTAVGGTAPDDAGPFVPVVGVDGYTMPATQHDVWAWVSGASYDVVFDTIRAVAAAFAEIATVASEQHGFTYRDSRDLTGFIDGTENPPLDEAPLLATVPSGLPGEGGSIVLVQRWEHDLVRFHDLSEPGQELVFGRTKTGSIELDEDRMPADAHVARVVIDGQDGGELEIFRRTTSFATLATQGAMFVAFSADRQRLDRMLARMAGAGDGIRDRLSRYSTPTTGSYYFAPPLGATPTRR